MKSDDHELEIKKWVENAEEGIRDDKPNYVLTSVDRLSKINEKDIAEKLLREAFDIFDNNVQLFRKLSSIISQKDAEKGIEFAEKNINKFGNDAFFQKALALSMLKRNSEAIAIIERIIQEEPQFVNNRFVASKFFNLLNDVGDFSSARKFLEPLIDDGIFKDTRMKQLLCTVLTKLRENPEKVLDLLRNDVDPRSTRLKEQARKILTIDNESGYFSGVSPVSDIEKNPSFNTAANRVFIVHGHNESIRESTARYIEKMKLTPIILHEQANKGRTIIEKFEEFSDVSFAVILLTGDDRGGLASDSFDTQKLRARQNVILELGFFIGKLGRERVCALYEEGVEIPSDYQGVLFVPLDKHGTWRMLLARELKEAGLKLDMNDAI